jgi:hypothetical protein
MRITALADAWICCKNGASRKRASITSTAVCRTDACVVRRGGSVMATRPAPGACATQWIGAPTMGNVAEPFLHVPCLAVAGTFGEHFAPEAHCPGLSHNRAALRDRRPPRRSSRGFSEISRNPVDNPTRRAVIFGARLNMIPGSDDSMELCRRIERGDESALLELFARHRDRLKRMVNLRLDRWLRGRLGAPNVLQEASIDVARRAREYPDNPTLPVFLWLRWLTGQRIQDVPPMAKAGKRGCPCALTQRLE